MMKTLPVTWGWEKKCPAAKRWRSNLERLYGNKKGFMFTLVTLTNGDKSLTMRAMLDTGAAQTFVSADVVDRLGLEKIAEGWNYGVGGCVKTYAVECRANLKDGPTFNLWASVLTIGFDCVLGLDFMRQAGVVLDTVEGSISYTKTCSRPRAVPQAAEQR